MNHFTYITGQKPQLGDTVVCCNPLYAPSDISEEGQPMGRLKGLTYGDTYMVRGLTDADTVDVKAVATGEWVTGLYPSRFALVTPPDDATDRKTILHLNRELGLRRDEIAQARSERDAKDASLAAARRTLWALRNQVAEAIDTVSEALDG